MPYLGQKLPGPAPRAARTPHGLEPPVPKAGRDAPLAVPSHAVGCRGVGVVCRCCCCCFYLKSYNATIKRLRSPRKFSEKSAPKQAQTARKGEAFSVSPRGSSRHGLGCGRGSPAGTGTSRARPSSGRPPPAAPQSSPRCGEN